MARDVDRFCKKFADNVKLARKERGLSHEKLAALAQVTRTTIANIESHRKLPTIATCYKVADALGIKLSELVESAE